MPAPSFLSGLPKPVLFGLYGAVGGFAGALVVAEPLQRMFIRGILELDTAAEVKWHLLKSAAVWFSAIVVPICLALLAGQSHYLRGGLPTPRGVAAGLGGGLAAGVVGGLVGQWVFFYAPQSLVLNILVRVVTWAMAGGLAGIGLSLVIPNMKLVLGLGGGAAGGGVGCLGFVAASMAFENDTVGRVIGGAVLGFFIGLMVVAAERAFRRAWLEVRYGARETITVNLGPEPVKIGGDAKACTVWARGAAPVALRFFVRNGRIVCHDVAAGGEVEADDGFAERVGSLTVTVRTGGAAAPAAPRRPARPPAQAAPLSLDDDFSPPPPVPPPTPVFDDDPPAPPPARRPPPPPVAARPAPAPRVATPPVPPPPPAAVRPPVRPPAPPPPRDPDSCPTCGRKNAGRAGQRYCVLCDETY